MTPAITSSLIIGLISSVLSIGGSLWIAHWTRLDARQALDQARQLTANRNDIDLLTRFADFHFDRGKNQRYRFSLYIVEPMTNPGFQKGLRAFVFRDVLVRNFKESKPTHFDKDDDDWVLAGDALGTLRRYWVPEGPTGKEQTFSDWWCDEQQWAVKRWPHQKKVLLALYAYLNDEYLSDRHFPYLKTPLAAIRRCDLEKTSGSVEAR